jgi:hypothetical protein
MFRRAPGVQWKQFGSEAILLDAASGEYVQINDVGALIWEALDVPAVLDDVIARVCARFDDAPPDAAAEVTEFLQSLVDRRFIVTSPA